jgi:hypothetical protein
MKKLAVLSMTFMVTVAVLMGQAQKTEKVKEAKKEQKSERVALKKLEGATVDNKAKIAFDTDFKGASNVQSKRVDTYDEFSFTNKDGHKMKAFYDENSVLVGTTQDKAMADLPAKGLQKIKEMYKDYSIGPVVFFNDNELNETDMILWGIQFDDTNNYFAELSKGTKKIIVKVSPGGSVNFFKNL